jgi:outer membrane lipoprotein carrier protein|tara:strand:- start:191 stop:832 length:642 start_codon:yes stop_codon:yes gene_type:complete
MPKFKNSAYIAVMFVGFFGFDLSVRAINDTFNINDYLSGINTLKAEFKQTIYSSSKEAIDYSEGLIWLKKPEQILWEFQRPNIKKIIVDGESVSIYDANLNQLLIVPYTDQYQSSLASILINNDNLEVFYEIQTKINDDGFYLITLFQKKDDSLFTKIEISISEMLIHTIKLWDSSGQSISIFFENIEMNISLPDSSFKFMPPKGVDIFDQRE